MADAATSTVDAVVDSGALIYVCLIPVRVVGWQAGRMCRNIRVLHNFEPPATNDEVRAAALQYVRKVSGTTKPSAANHAAFDEAVDQIARATTNLLDALVTTAPKKDRAAEAGKARARAAARYGSAQPS